MSGTGSARLDGGTGGRSSAGGVFPRCLHVACRDCPHRLLEQECSLWPAVQSVSANGIDNRSRPQAPRREGRHDQRAAYLGFGTDPPSSCPHDCSGWRSVAKWQPLGCMQAGVLCARAGVVTALSTPVHRRAAGPASRSELVFFGDLAELSEPQAFAAYLAPLRKIEWVVYAKPPFGGPEAVLAYLSRYSHRVAISNSRLISADANTVMFRWKDYRMKDGDRQNVMCLSTSDFIRRFLIHVLPDRFHRIRHYGMLASSQRKANIARVRILLGAQVPKQDDPPAAEIIPLTLREPCPDCGGAMRIIETFRRGQKPQSRAPPRKAAA